MKQYKLIAIIIPCLGLLACGTGRSADVKQSTIEQNYTLSYNESSAELIAGAGFYYENTLGTSLKLTGSSQINFNGSPMLYENMLNSARYHIESEMISVPSTPFEFRFVNNDGEVFVTPARVPPKTAISLPHEGDSLPVDQELQVIMRGDSLLKGEELTLCLVYEPLVASASDPGVKECLRSTGRLTLVFSREQLAQFPSDRELSLEIRRESHPELNNPRIHLAQAFMAKPVPIILK